MLGHQQRGGSPSSHRSLSALPLGIRQKHGILHAAKIRQRTDAVAQSDAGVNVLLNGERLSRPMLGVTIGETELSAFHVPACRRILRFGGRFVHDEKAVINGVATLVNKTDRRRRRRPHVLIRLRVLRIRPS